MDGNGNGFSQPLNIDVTDEHAFRAGVLQHLQFIADRTSCIPELKKKVDKHEMIVKVGKWVSLPIIGVMQEGLKYLLAKAGL